MAQPMVAVPDPALFADFTQGQNPVGWRTFVRPSPAWYWDANGALQEASSGVARFDHDPKTGASLGLRVESQRTNVLLDNRDLSAGNWSGTATVAKDAVGLDGVPNSANTITDNDTGSQQHKTQQITISDDSATHSVAFWIKKDNDESRFPLLVADIVGGTTPQREQTKINTKTGDKSSIVSTGTTTIEDAGGYWKVISIITNNSTGNTALTYAIYPAYATGLNSGDGYNVTGSIVYDFGQFELNTTFASSPIETAGTAATREADDASIPVGSWYNANEGTWVVEWRSDADIYTVLGSYGSSIKNRIYLANDSIRVDAGSSTFADSFIAAAGENRIAFAADSAGMAHSINGGVATESEETASSGTVTDLNVGRNVVTGDYLNGSLARITHYPSRLSNAELQNLVAR